MELPLTKNDTKDAIKVSRSLGNEGILLKGITNKIISQKRGFMNFFRLLMTTNLPLITNASTSLNKNVLRSLGLIAAASATDSAIQNNTWISSVATLTFSNEEVFESHKNS